MITQKEIKNLTKEQALQLHKEMWLAMSRYELVNNKGLIGLGCIELEDFERKVRNEFKSRYLDERNLELLHDCFLCEFAAQELLRKEGLDVLSGNYCKYCPVNWCKGCEKNCDKKSSYFCECEKGGLVWGLSNILEIANIDLKEEN